MPPFSLACSLISLECPCTSFAMCSSSCIGPGVSGTSKTYASTPLGVSLVVPAPFFFARPCLSNDTSSYNPYLCVCIRILFRLGRVGNHETKEFTCPAGRAASWKRVPRVFVSYAYPVRCSMISSVFPDLNTNAQCILSLMDPEGICSGLDATLKAKVNCT